MSTISAADGKFGEKIRIILVDDSSVARALWRSIFSETNDCEVVGSAANGTQALEVLKVVSADIVLLDLEMPEMDGMTAIPLILREHATVRIIIASALSSKGSELALQALQLGALDYVTKPSALAGSQGFQDVAHELLRKVRALGKLRSPSAQETHQSSIHEEGKATGSKVNPKVIVIGTSTGGPQALSVVLGALSPRVQLPILVVQHMPTYFTQVLADSLEKQTKRPCKEAREGEKIEPGHIYIAPGDFHLVLEKHIDSKVAVSLTKGEPEHFCRPSVNPLFRSAASVYGPATLAVVLSGLGEDGKDGAQAVVDKGGTVLVQDEATSVVWGMPGAVARAGLAAQVLPLQLIAVELERLSTGVVGAEVPC